MSFGENLQYLRKRQNVTQEQLAEKMGVSRQTISKWESDSSYPEMEKILTLCEMFGCRMDDLIRGSVENVNNEDRELYDRHMDSHSRKLSLGVMVVIMAVALAQLTEGAGLGDTVSSLCFWGFMIVGVVTLVVTSLWHEEFVRRHPEVHVEYTDEEKEEMSRKYPVRMGVGIGLILMGFLWAGGFEGFSLGNNGDALQGGGFLMFIAVGVGVLLYSNMQREKMDVWRYNKESVSLSRRDLEERKRNDKASKICACIMLGATLIYVVLGFIWLLWGRAWVVFPVGGILCAIVSIAYKKEEQV